MEVQDHARERVAAFLDAQRGRIVEALAEGLGQSGATALLPVHCALLDLAREHVREPSPRRTVAGVHRALAGTDFRPDIQSLVSGQIALYVALHRMLREVEGPHRERDVIHAALALTGDTVDGITGVLIDVAQSRDASVAFPGWGTLVEIGRTRREFQTLNQVTHDLLSARDPARMFEVLEGGILDTFHLRSLVIAAVDHQEAFVEVIRAYPLASGASRDPIGWRFDLSHPDILCDVARTGRTEVIDGWDPRYHEQIVRPDGSTTFRQRPRDFNAGQTAFFVPILAGDRAVGVVCTGSTQESKPVILREIERMRPFLHQAGATLSNVSEIVERRRAEEAMRQAEQKYRSIFENAPEGIFQTTVDGRFLTVNPTAARMLGYDSPEELIAAVTDIERQLYVAPEHRGAFRRLLEERGAVRGFEVQAYRKDGSVIWVSLNAHAVRDEGGAVLYYEGTAQDITGRRRAEEQLLAYQEQLRSLASELTLTEERERRRIALDLHDRIVQALALAQMKLEALRPSAPSAGLAGPLNEVCGLIDQSIQDARSLTFDLSPPVLFELGLEAAVEWLSEQTRRQHGIQVDFEDDGRPKPIDGDVRVLLFRAVRELLINVVKHTRASHAKVSLRRDGRDIRIEVEDDGAGFDTSRIGLHADRPGGFGLFSIRERLDLLRGHFQVESWPGRGTRAVLLAPLRRGKKTTKGDAP